MQSAKLSFFMSHIKAKKKYTQNTVDYKSCPIMKNYKWKSASFYIKN